MTRRERRFLHVEKRSLRSVDVADTATNMTNTYLPSLRHAGDFKDQREAGDHDIT